MSEAIDVIISALFRLGQEWYSNLENGTPHAPTSQELLQIYKTLGFRFDGDIMLVHYEDSERGFVPEDETSNPDSQGPSQYHMAGKAPTSCSSLHLNTILNHVRVMKLNALLMNEKALEKGLSFAKRTEHEIERLHRNPSLFPNESETKNFWQAVAGEDLGAVAEIFSRRRGLFTGYGHEHAMDEELQAEMWDRNTSRQPHLDPWAQFLCNRAPGSDFEFVDQPDGCVQLLPMAACRILKTIKDEDVALAHRIRDEGRKQGLALGSSFIPREPKPPQFTAEGNIRTFKTETRSIPDNLVNEDDSPYSNTPLLLEQLNSAHDLLTHGVTDRIGGWNRTSVIIHERPLKGQDRKSTNRQ